MSTASFVRSDGTTSTAADVSLAYRPSTAPARGSDLGTGSSRFGLSLSPAFLGDAYGFVRELPDRGALFDMLRGDNADALAQLFDAFGEQSSPSATERASVATQFASAGTVRARSTQYRPAEREFFGETGDVRSLQVLPATRIAFGEEQAVATDAAGRQAEAALARRLMMISQDMATFGAPSGVEALRQNRMMLDPLEFYA